MRHFLMGILALTVCLCLLAGCGSAARYAGGGYTPATTAATTAEEEISLCGTWKLNSTDAIFASAIVGNSFLTLSGANVDALDEDETGTLRYMFEKDKITVDMMTPVVKRFCDGLVLSFDERGVVKAMIDPEICKECILDCLNIAYDALSTYSLMEVAEVAGATVEEIQGREEDVKKALKDYVELMRALAQKDMKEKMADNTFLVSKTYDGNVTLNANGMIEFPAVSYSQNGKYATIKDEKCSAVRNIKIVKAGSGARITDATIDIGGEVEQFSAALILEKGMRLERVSA